MNARKLKPCPFCGGDARLDISDETVWRVECVHCDCNYGHIFRDEAQAIEAWNTRAALPEQPQEEWKRTAYNEWVRVSDGLRVFMTLEGYAQDLWGIEGGRKGFRSAESAMAVADAAFDSHESESRELLREAAYWLEWEVDVKAIAMADRIRKHLGGDSDAKHR